MGEKEKLIEAFNKADQELSRLRKARDEAVVAYYAVLHGPWQTAFRELREYRAKEVT